MRILLSENSSEKCARREKRARRQNRARRGKCARKEKHMIREDVHTSTFKHQWFRGRIVACHAIDPGSVPARCNLLSAHEKCANYYQRIAAKNAHAEKNAHVDKNAHA